MGSPGGSSYRIAHRIKKEVIIVAKRSEIAEDLRQHAGGALISVTCLADYLGMSRKKARDLVSSLEPVGIGTGKRYFYKDIAQRLGGVKNV